MKIIKHSKTIESVSYTLTFAWRDDDGAGFGFDCDADGNVDVAVLNPDARKNYERCLDGTYDVDPTGVAAWHGSYREPAIGLCSCGAEVELEGFTNTCPGCGTDYNWGGQELAPREQWGEETGELWYEVAQIR